MGWFILKHLFSTVFMFLKISRLSIQEKDLEILVLQQQLTLMQRKLDKPVRPSRVEKMTLAILTAQLKELSRQTTAQLRRVMRLFQPETVLRWHRELARRKWTYPQKNKGGRPATSQELENLILQLARENPRWGYGKIHGALLLLNFKISEPTVRNILKRHAIEPAPMRAGSLGWRQLMKHYKDQILACDFFTVETLGLQTHYVLFFIELGTRRVHFAGITKHPHQLWVAQHARQVVWEFSEGEKPFRFLIHDNDGAFGAAFAAVFKSEGVRVIKTPFRAPNANAFAERWIRTAREECLDHLLIINVAHLRRVFLEFIHYYNTGRPHQGVAQRTPIPGLRSTGGVLQRRTVLGGLINTYERVSIPALNSPT